MDFCAATSSGEQAVVGIPGFHRLGMCPAQVLFQDAARLLPQQLRLFLFALFFKEFSQALKRLGHLRMLRSQRLFVNVQCPLVE